MKMPDLKQDGKMHESIVNDVANPSISVLSAGSDHQAYPEFILRMTSPRRRRPAALADIGATAVRLGLLAQHASAKSVLNSFLQKFS